MDGGPSERLDTSPVTSSAAAGHGRPSFSRESESAPRASSTFLPASAVGVILGLGAFLVLRSHMDGTWLRVALSAGAGGVMAFGMVLAKRERSARS